MMPGRRRDIIKDMFLISKRLLSGGQPDRSWQSDELGQAIWTSLCSLKVQFVRIPNSLNTDTLGWQPTQPIIPSIIVRLKENLLT